MASKIAQAPGSVSSVILIVLIGVAAIILVVAIRNRFWTITKASAPATMPCTVDAARVAILGQVTTSVHARVETLAPEDAAGTAYLVPDAILAITQVAAWELDDGTPVEPVGAVTAIDFDGMASEASDGQEPCRAQNFDTRNPHENCISPESPYGVAVGMPLVAPKVSRAYVDASQVNGVDDASWDAVVLESPAEPVLRCKSCGTRVLHPERAASGAEMCDNCDPAVVLRLVLMQGEPQLVTRLDIETVECLRLITAAWEAAADCTSMTVEIEWLQNLMQAECACTVGFDEIIEKLRATGIVVASSIYYISFAPWVAGITSVQELMRRVLGALKAVDSGDTCRPPRSEGTGRVLAMALGSGEAGEAWNDPRAWDDING